MRNGVGTAQYCTPYARGLLVLCARRAAVPFPGRADLDRSRRYLLPLAARDAEQSFSRSTAAMTAAPPLRGYYAILDVPVAEDRKSVV